MPPWQATDVAHRWSRVITRWQYDPDSFNWKPRGHLLVYAFVMSKNLMDVIFLVSQSNPEELPCLLTIHRGLPRSRILCSDP